ncbi:hypothetical protein [Gilvimarinus japonicus]|uniref:Uncharacterized protein n=1 Tax=Gilvimarinus japonicus TaxID=1796469 RepID=A0ABV7HRE6_9GAMM
MNIKQVGLLALVSACAAAWGADSLVAVPYRLIGVAPATVNGQAGQRVTLGTGREGETCYLLLNDKSAQGGRIENINGLSRDQGFRCVRDGVAFDLAATGGSYFRGDIRTGSTITLQARLLAKSGQVLDVYTSQPVRISF